MIPLRPSELEYLQNFPKWIILHHVEELGLNTGEYLFDNSKSQITQLQKTFFQLTSVPMLPYHYVVEQMGPDYQIVVERPLLTKCDFDVTDDTYLLRGIHIGLLGNYNEDIPPNRLYHVLAFRLLIPLMRTFRIKEERILFHNQISKNENETSPGEFFKKDKLLADIRRSIRKQSVSRT